MELRGLRSFVTLARELHFGRTAQQLMVSTSRVSQDLRQLEQTLGVPLFFRTSRRVVLTPQGSLLLPHAERLLADADELVELARATREVSAGHLPVAYAPGTSVLLAPAVAAFRRTHPNVTIGLHQCLSLAVAEAVQSGLASVGIAVVTLPGLESIVLDEHPMDTLMVPADHRLADRTSATLEDLEGEVLLTVTRRSNPGFHDEFTQFFVRQHVQPTLKRVEITSPQELVDLVTAGQGLALTATPDASQVGSRMFVRAVPVRGEVPVQRVFLLWRSDDHDPLVQHFAALATPGAVEHPAMS